MRPSCTSPRDVIACTHPPLLCVQEVHVYGATLGLSEAICESGPAMKALEECQSTSVPLLVTVFLLGVCCVAISLWGAIMMWRKHAVAARLRTTEKSGLLPKESRDAKGKMPT